MTAKQFEEIKAKSSAIKERISREKGARDQLTAQLKELMGEECSVDDAEKRKAELELKKEKLQTKWDNASSHLEKLTDWSKV